MQNNLQGCYQVLDLEPGKSLDEVKRSYRELVKVWHPDRFTGDTKLQQKAQEKLKQINLAYELLEEFFKSQDKAGQSGSTPKSSQEAPPFLDREEFYKLGYSFYMGQGKSKNLSEAARWLKKSAEMGLDKAQALLGVMYNTGEGVTKDVFEAVRWLKLAADQKNPLACYWLGLNFAEGFGSNILQKAVKTGIDWSLGDSKVEAYKYFNLAVTYGVYEGQKGMYDVKTCMMQSQINEARKRASEFYPLYPERSARETIVEWFKVYFQELAKNPKRAEKFTSAKLALNSFQNLETDIADMVFKNLQDSFFANRTSKAFSFFKTVGAVWKGKSDKREDHAGLLAFWLIEDNYGLSPHYICAKENFINQLWQKIYCKN